MWKSAHESDLEMSQKQSGSLGSDKIVVYTCVTGNYDSIARVRKTEPDVEFVCFSDRPDKVPPEWTSLPLQSPPRLAAGHDVNRFHKLFPHRIFPNSRFSIYIDGNVRFNGSFRELVDKLQSSSAALAAFSHPEGRSVEEESEVCERIGKFCRYDRTKRLTQIKEYANEGFDLSEMVTANYLLVRDHGYPELATAMSLWWSSLFEFTKRDQISLNEVLWKTQLPWKLIDKDLGICPNRLVRVPHAQSLLRTIVAAAIRRIKGTNPVG